MLDSLLPTFGFLIVFFRLFSIFLTIFGLMRLVPFVLAIVGMNSFRKKDGDSAALFGAWALLTYGFDFLAWFFSRHNILPEQAMLWWTWSPSVGRAGFPFHWLELPSSMDGNDLPPVGEWYAVFINLIFWATVSAVIIIGLRILIDKAKLKKINSGRSWMWLLIGAFFINQVTNVMFALWFD